MGVFVPFIDYRHGFYNTSWMEMTKPEKELYEMRKNILDISVRGKTQYLRKAFDGGNLDIDKDIPEDTLEMISNKFIEDKIVLNPQKTQQLDLKYLTPYSNTLGFSLYVDGIYNPPNNGLFVVMFCINPPGNLYMETPDSEQVFFANRIDFNSPQTCPKYRDDWFRFENMPLEKNSHVLFTVKEVVLAKKGQPKVKDVGFGILPLATADEGALYSYTGIYQVPLFKKDLTKNVVEELSRRSPWNFMLELMTTKDSKLKSMKVQMLEYTSIFVRVKDNYYETLYREPFDYSRLNTAF